MSPASAQNRPALGEIQEGLAPERWRVYEAAAGQLSEIDHSIDWARLYDTSGTSLDELLSWSSSLRQVVAELAERLGSAAGRSDEELEDVVYWSSRQLEGNLQQPLGLLERLSREALDSSLGLEIEEDLWPLCVAIADVVGRLRNDLRKLSAFVVAENRWEVDVVETVLFPAKLAELERSRELKRGLVRLLECFQGSDERVPVAQVVSRFRAGSIQGPHAVVELELLGERLEGILRPPTCWALYVDSYQRLVLAARQLGDRLQELERALGDGEKERGILRELSALLDVELLAVILGEEDLGRITLPADGERISYLLRKRALEELALEVEQRERLAAMRAELQAGAALSEHDRELLERAAAEIRGRQIVERLRTPGRMPEQLQELARERQLLLDSEDGLGTYLVLLYGQVQHRDLHLLAERPEDVSLAERQVAVQEVHAFVGRLHRSAGYRHLEEVLTGEASRQEQRIADLVRAINDDLVPRLRRLASFPEVEGSPREIADALELKDETATDELLGRLPETLAGIRKLRFGLLPEVLEEPEDPEELLRRLGL